MMDALFTLLTQPGKIEEIIASIIIVGFMFGVLLAAQQGMEGKR